MLQDEAGFGRINKPKYCWCERGIRPSVPCHHIREYYYAFGAVEPLTGNHFFLILPKCNTACMNTFLQELSDTFPNDMKSSGESGVNPDEYLTRQEQRDLLETMESEDCTPSLSQAIQMKKLSQAGKLDVDRIFEILREPKANQQDKISFRTADIRKFFPKSYDVVRVQKHILKLLEADYRKRQRAQER